MAEHIKNQTGINNISSEWFKAKIDRKKLKELSRRNDYEGWKHIIIFTTSLTVAIDLPPGPKFHAEENLLGFSYCFFAKTK